MKKRVCKHCGELYRPEALQQRYCNPKCRQDAQVARYRRPAVTPWYVTHWDTLVSMCAAGHKSADIAEACGVSRNAVIGVWNRRGIPHRDHFGNVPNLPTETQEPKPEPETPEPEIATSEPETDDKRPSWQCRAHGCRNTRLRPYDYCSHHRPAFINKRAQERVPIVEAGV